MSQLIEVWAAKEQPHEIRGLVIDRSDNLVRISSFLLQRNRYVPSDEFKDECISYSLPIPAELLTLAEDTATPIVFTPGKGKESYKLKVY